jgi:hypothetical protein
MTIDDRTAIVPGHKPSRMTPVVRQLLVALTISTVILSGCHSRDEIEIDGDAHGVPVIITVRYAEEIFEVLEPQGYFQPVYDSHHTGFVFAPGFMAFTFHQGYDVTRPAIRAILLGGDRSGDDSLWYWPLHYGVQEASVAIRPGHVVAITLRGEGGERGEQLLGTITPSAAPTQHIDILLGGSGAHIFAGGASPTSPQWSAPPSAPPGGGNFQPPPPPPPVGGYAPPPPPPPGRATAPPPPPPPPPGQ